MTSPGCDNRGVVKKQTGAHGATYRRRGRWRWQCGSGGRRKTWVLGTAHAGFRGLSGAASLSADLQCGYVMGVAGDEPGERSRGQTGGACVRLRSSDLTL